jgi:tetratricopeptide (TPR) repeat protein
MIESPDKNELERKIDQYIDGQLSDEEIEELWAVLIQDGDYLDYLKSAANLKAVMEKKRKSRKPAHNRPYWSYAAAAVVILVIAVMTVLNMPAFQGADSVEPIESIELEYYRSSDGTVDSATDPEVIPQAISLANSGESEQAISILEQELNQARQDEWVAELSIQIGSLQYNSDRYDESIESFERVTNLDEVDVLVLEKAYWYLGNAYFQMDRLDEAYDAIERAYELDGAYRRVAGSYLDALGDSANAR